VPIVDLVSTPPKDGKTLDDLPLDAYLVVQHTVRPALISFIFARILIKSASIASEPATVKMYVSHFGDLQIRVLYPSLI